MAVAGALALGLLLQGPSLTAGFRSDDYVQRAMLRARFPSPRSAWDLFDFAAGTPGDFRRLQDFGHLPWWSSPDLRLRMWRPLASGLIAADHALFGDDARYQHMHSLLWYALLLLTAAAVLRRVLPEPAAILALFAFAASPCHNVPVGWLANRSTLLATTLGFSALLLQLKAASAGGRSAPMALGGAALSGLALLCGEYALSALAFCIAQALVVSPGPRSALRASLPVALPALGYLVVHHAVGSDIVGSGYYLSPVHSPWAFIKALFTRVPVLVADLVFGLPSLYLQTGSPLRNTLLSWHLFTPQVWLRLPSWQTWHVLLGYCAIGVALAMLRSLAPLLAERTAPLRWLALGAALAMLPCAGSIPEDRLLVAAALGSCALQATLLIAAFPLRKRPLARGPRWLTTGLWLITAWAVSNNAWRSYDGPRRMREGSAIARAWALDADLPDRAHRDARVYLLTVGDFNTAVNVPWVRLLYGHPLPRSYRRLCPGGLPVDVTRPSERVLEVNILTNGVYGTAVPSLYRVAARPMRIGERATMPGLQVQVLRVLDDNPSRLRFTFDRSVDDPSLWFLLSTRAGLRRTHMPHIGQRMRVPFARMWDVRH